MRDSLCVVNLESVLAADVAAAVACVAAVEADDAALVACVSVFAIAALSGATWLAPNAAAVESATIVRTFNNNRRGATG